MGEEFGIPYQFTGTKRCLTKLVWSIPLCKSSRWEHWARWRTKIKHWWSRQKNNSSQSSGCKRWLPASISSCKWHRRICTFVTLYGWIWKLRYKKLWMKCGMGISQRFIPIHSLYHKLQKSVINSLLKLQILTRRDVTSKVGIKLAAMKASEEVNLWKFCSFESKEYGFKKIFILLKFYMENQLVQPSMSSRTLLFCCSFSN